MKGVIALLVFICITTITLYLSAIKQFDLKLTVSFLVFAIFSPFIILKYDDISRFKWGSVEVETARKQIDSYKEEAISQIKNEVSEQKESIKLLITNVNQTSERIERQKDALNDLIEVAKRLETRIDEQAKKVLDLNQSAESTKNSIELLNLASNQTALIIIKANYLMMATKNEFGTSRANKAIDEVVDGINKLLPLAMPDPHERKKWIHEIENILPKR